MITNWVTVICINGEINEVFEIIIKLPNFILSKIVITFIVLFKCIERFYLKFKKYKTFKKEILSSIHKLSTNYYLKNR